MKAGTVLACPKCSRPQLRSTADVPVGGQIREANFESLGFPLDPMDMKCHACGEPWSRKHPTQGHTQLFTEDNGWISLNKKPLIVN